MSDELRQAERLLHATETDALLTVKEYAALNRVHIQTVYSSIRRGLFPHRVERPTPGTIRIIVSRESITALPAA
jgi:hypothetical protein